jgi:hypothetical protein
MRCHTILLFLLLLLRLGKAGWLAAAPHGSLPNHDPRCPAKFYPLSLRYRQQLYQQIRPSTARPAVALSAARTAAPPPLVRLDDKAPSVPSPAALLLFLCVRLRL